MQVVQRENFRESGSDFRDSSIGYAQRGSQRRGNLSFDCRLDSHCPRKLEGSSGCHGGCFHCVSCFFGLLSGLPLSGWPCRVRGNRYSADGLSCHPPDTHRSRCCGTDTGHRDVYSRVAGALAAAPEAWANHVTHLALRFDNRCGHLLDGLSPLSSKLQARSWARIDGE